MDPKPQARLIAFYLPQYHPIPENDLWWGKGFTEWTNVARAKPLFRGHDQPRLPADLGYYDLRVPETRQDQADLARQHGVEGFCYWHYWMGGGKMLLQRPFEEVLRSGQPDFPFCVAWANHSWTRTWHGSRNNILMPQEYPGEDDHRRHFDYLLPALTDSRYICVDGKPLIHIFRPMDIPDAGRFIELWRKLAQSAGLDGLYLVGQGAEHDPVIAAGYDASNAIHTLRVRSESARTPAAKVRLRLNDAVRKALRKPEVYEYEQAMPYFLPPGEPALHEHPSIISGWDTTPRLGRNGFVLHHFSPELFRQHVHQALQKVCGKPETYRILFLKSWNEWAEGNTVEPDRRYGAAFLEALRDELFSGLC